MTDLEKNAYIAIRRKSASSRAELARMLRISRPTASTAVESLISHGLVCECGKGKSTGGAAPTLLSVNKKSSSFIGIDFGYTDRMSGVLIDGAGDIVRQDEISFDPDSLEGITDRAGELFRRLAGGKVPDGAAIALSAVIDEKSRRVLKSVNPLFCGGRIGELLTEKLGVPVYFSNRSRSAAISEAFGGAADKESDFALISLGKSVGAAFWCGGRLFCGSGSSAGEIRNLRISGGARLETALARDRVAVMAPEEITAVCTDALSQIVDIMDLKLLVLSGRFADFGEDFFKHLEQELCSLGVTVRSARFGRFSAARGSAFQMGEYVIKNQ